MQCYAPLLYPTELVHSQTNSTFPAITQHPIGSIAIPGDSVSLSCAVEEEAHLIKWFRDNNLVVSGPEYRIAALSEDSVGSYTCRATVHKVGTVTSAIARVELACKLY